MATDVLTSEARAVASFDRIVANDYGELIITQGEQESLIVESRQDFLPKLSSEVRDGKLILGIGGSIWNKLDLSTSLTRKVIRYRLTVRKLSGIEVNGVLHVVASGIVADHLLVRLHGAAPIDLDSLTARLLEVELRGPGSMTVTGHAAEQRVSLSGVGAYHAAGLMSNKATVHVTGPGRATVWAVHELNVVADGLGDVAYYGAPVVTKRISGMGRLASLGKAEQ